MSWIWSAKLFWHPCVLYDRVWCRRCIGWKWKTLFIDGLDSRWKTGFYVVEEPHWIVAFVCKQGKSEGFDSCDQPGNFAWNWIQIIDFSVHVTFKFDWWIQTAVTVQKRSIWVKLGDFLSCVTLKFDGWPWQTIGYLFYATSSFVNHFKAISEFKLEWQSGNAQFRSKSAIFVPCDLEISRMTFKNNMAPLLCHFKIWASFHNHLWIRTGVTVRKMPILGQN